MKSFLIYPLLIALLALSVYSQSGLTDAQAGGLQQAHNKYRNLIAGGGNGQPTAADMNTLYWDRKLQAKAQAWADTNPSGHNPDRGSLQNGDYVGENIYWSWNSQQLAFDPEAAVKAWFSEIKDFNTDNVESYNSASDRGVTGHYTQLVWGKSYLVGCGRKYAKESMWKTTVVCNYAPGGNILQQPIYEKGSPASSCKKKNANFPNLCDLSGNLFVEDAIFENLITKYNSAIEQRLKEISHKKAIKQEN